MYILIDLFYYYFISFYFKYLCSKVLFIFHIALTISDSNSSESNEHCEVTRFFFEGQNIEKHWNEKCWFRQSLVIIYIPNKEVKQCSATGEEMRVVSPASSIMCLFNVIFLLHMLRRSSPTSVKKKKSCFTKGRHMKV